MQGFNFMVPGLRIAVEGNIGVGKSSLLPRLKEQLGGTWEVMDERADEDPEFKALLAAFNKDPNKQAQFQSWITQRRLQEFKSLAQNPTHYLFERSFLGELVFCHANFMRHEKPDGHFMGYYYNILSALKQCRYDAVVYLKASPEKCFDRIRYRARKEENTIGFEYVRHLHACYETHLLESARVLDIPVLTVDWENFGSTETVCEQISALLEMAKPGKQLVL
jgi:deoxyadenosine/deoxycytidine kinase